MNQSNTPQSHKVLITPEMATKFLEKNKNRPISQPHVSRIAKQIADGNWKYNAIPIIFDTDGFLRDGQHRLSAIVKSGIAVECAIAYDADPESFPTMGITKSRSTGEILAVHGVSYYNEIAAAIKVVHLYLNRKISLTSNIGSAEWDRDQIVELYDTKYSDISAFAEFYSSKTKRSRIHNVSRIVALSYLASKTDFQHEQSPEEFFEQLISESGYQADSPMCQLNQILNRNAIDKKKLTTSFVFAYYVKAIYYFLKNTKVKHLSMRNDEAFPYWL